MTMLKPRARKVRILATLGPASSSPEMIRALVEAGADAFRINMSHGSQAEKAKLVEAIRALEKELHRPTTILVDLQGPKLRVGKFKGGRPSSRPARLRASTATRSRATRRGSSCPHPELFEAVETGARLLIDDGKVRLRVAAVEQRPDRAEVEVGGKVTNNKGVNVPDVVVPIPALTEKDRERPRLRARAGRRLDRPVVRPAARGRRRGAAADRRQGGAARQDREAGGDRAARRDLGAGRRGDGRARRPRRRAAARRRCRRCRTGSSPRRARRASRWWSRRRCSNR